MVMQEKDTPYHCIINWNKLYLCALRILCVFCGKFNRRGHGGFTKDTECRLNFAVAVGVDNKVNVLVAATRTVDENRTDIHLLSKLHAKRYGMRTF